MKKAKRRKYWWLIPGVQRGVEVSVSERGVVVVVVFIHISQH